MIEIICSKCGISKPTKEFYKDKQKKSGYRPDCKACNRIITKEYAKNNREKVNFNNKKYITGLSKDDYLAILKEQNYGCAICGKTEEDNKKTLCVDHCHTSNLIRGLLCTNCNFALGYFKDNEELLSKAKLYLKNNKSKDNLIFKEWKKKRRKK